MIIQDSSKSHSEKRELLDKFFDKIVIIIEGTGPGKAEPSPQRVRSANSFNLVKLEAVATRLPDGAYNVVLTLRNGMTNELYVAGDTQGAHRCSAELEVDGAAYQIAASTDCVIRTMSHGSWGYSEDGFLEHIKAVGMTIMPSQRGDIKYVVRGASGGLAPPQGSTARFCAALAIAYRDDKGKPVARRVPLCPDKISAG
jgi:hypothetical protein